MKHSITKKLLACVLALTLVLGIMRPTGAAATSLTADNLSETILNIRSRIGIGDEFTEFSYNFWENGDGYNWYFSWSDPETEREWNVSCDGEGHILYAYCYDFSKSGNDGAKYLRFELEEQAEAAAVKLNPEFEGHLKLNGSETNSYEGSYTYNFVRVENGIKMPQNSVSVELSYSTGELKEFYSSWVYNVEIPAADKLIGEEKAKEIIDSKVDMELEYHTGWDKNWENKTVFLAYSPSESYIAVDAVTGEVYDSLTDYNSGSKSADNSTKEAALTEEDAGGGEIYSLTEAELAEIDKLGDLMTSDEAVELLKSMNELLIPETATSVNAQLYHNADSYSWQISLSDERPIDYENEKDYYRPYVNATIDAASGELLNFWAETKSYWGYTLDELKKIEFKAGKSLCRKTFKALAEKLEPEKLEKSKLTSTDPTNWIYAYNPKTGEDTVAEEGAYAFRYTRYYEDVPYRDNYIYGAVDRITGKIYSYNVSWTDEELPTTANVIGEEAAFDTYMGYDGYELVYEVVTNYDENWNAHYSVRLVYRTQISPYYVDANSGEQLQWNGQPYTGVSGEFEYDDIEGHEYERAIIGLADLGAGFEGGSYEPDKAITRAEFDTLMSKLNIGNYYDRKEVKSKKTLTHQYAAKMVISELELDVLAKLDIYKLSFKDRSKVSKSYKGYVALATGLDIIEVTDNMFNPKAPVTRGEAAQILLNMVTVSRLSD